MMMNGNYEVVDYSSFNSTEEIMRSCLNTDYTLFNLANQDSLFCKNLIELSQDKLSGGVTTDYYQFMLFIKNSEATTPLIPVNRNSVTFATCFDGTSDEIFIVPTHELDAKSQSLIHTFVKSRRDEINPDAPVITDDEALNRDLSGFFIRSYGTVSGNSWLAKHFAELPLKMESNQILDGSQFKGSNLFVFSAWADPFNIDNRGYILTAQRAEDIIPGIKNINSLRENDPSIEATSYLITQDGKVIKSGRYSFKNGKLIIE